ncbi:hypothetical protein [Nocardioides taihuensis]|uniref:Uncharacterized protein n=1 Tax=Nocardioides taihuensis TaxID=1835606 RepID=A0ABW0BDH9_9ACTN
MTRPEVRLHDVRVTGDVDRAALLAAIESAVADASVTGPVAPDRVRSAVSDAVSSVVDPPRGQEGGP